MEKTRYMKIKETWDGCKDGGRGCPKLVPSVYYATNENDDIYYVAKDYSTIAYLVYIHEEKSHTYAIPKKYLEIQVIDEDMKRYFIKRTSKLDLVSCSSKNVDDFDLFVVNNIISRI